MLSSPNHASSLPRYFIRPDKDNSDGEQEHYASLKPEKLVMVKKSDIDIGSFVEITGVQVGFLLPRTKIRHREFRGDYGSAGIVVCSMYLFKSCRVVISI